MRRPHFARPLARAFSVCAFALALLPATCAPLSLAGQTPQQLRELLDSLDLSDRDPELNIRIIWKQTDLIPGCRQNFRPGAACDSITFQLISGPIPRSQEIPAVDVEFLPNVLVNKLASATYRGVHSEVSKYCTGESVEALLAFRNAQRPWLNDRLRLTYLSLDDPWFFCFHRNNRAAAKARSEGRPIDLRDNVFWIWRADRIVGRANCSTPGSVPNSQCNLDLYFDDGNIIMSISPFDAVNLRLALSSLAPMTRRFWELTDVDTAAWGIDESLYVPGIRFDDRAKAKLDAIEAALR